MRILFLVENYREFYTSALSALNGVDRLTYEELCNHLYQLFFYHSDSYAYAAKKLGHKADQIILDYLPLQDRWARENVTGLWLRRKRPWRWWFTRIKKSPSWVWRSSEWKKEILLLQVKDYKPDVIYVFSGVPVDAQLLEELKKESRLLVCQWAAPLIPGYPYESYNLIISASVHLVEYFQKKGINSAYLNLAFDDRILELIDFAHQRTGVVFVGSFLSSHEQRRELLEYLCQHIDISIFGFIENVPDGSPILKKYRGLAAGLDMYRIFSTAKIVLHSHIDMSMNNAGAKRLYEATGMGAMLLTDQKENLSDLFDPGKEVVTYSSREDCLEKIKYYLEHDQERERIAKAGFQRTLHEYTYVAMMERLLKILNPHIENTSR